MGDLKIGMVLKTGQNVELELILHFSTASQLTLDSGIAEEVSNSYNSDSDSDSSFHCSSWEDEEEIRQGNSVRVSMCFYTSCTMYNVYNVYNVQCSCINV